MKEAFAIASMGYEGTNSELFTLRTHSNRSHRARLLQPIAVLILWLVLGATLVVGQGGTGREPPPPKKTPKSPPANTTTKAEVKPEPPSTVTASGEVRPNRYVTLTSEVAGRIQEIYVNPGEQVAKNQALVLIDSSQQAQSVIQQAAINEAQMARDELALARPGLDAAEAKVTQAKKDVATADSDFKTSERELKRATNLVESNLMSRSEWDAARDRYDQAKAKLAARNLELKKASEDADRQRAVVKEAQTRAESSAMRANYLDTFLRGQLNRRDKATQFSPLDGIVADIPTRTGQVVFGGLSGTTLMTLADMSAIYVEINVEEKEISRVEVGQQVRIMVDAFGAKEIRGLVTYKNPVAVDTSNEGGLSSRVNVQQAKEFKVTIEMRQIAAEIRSRLRPGMSATATITTRTNARK
jgi:multidrug efflux pump subunit AcrA (membrane-fusion protein)